MIEIESWVMCDELVVEGRLYCIPPKLGENRYDRLYIPSVIFYRWGTETGSSDLDCVYIVSIPFPSARCVDAGYKVQDICVKDFLGDHFGEIYFAPDCYFGALCGDIYTAFGKLSPSVIEGVQVTGEEKRW